MKTIYPGSEQRVIKKINELVPVNVFFYGSTKKANMTWDEINEMVREGRPINAFFIDSGNESRRCVVGEGIFFGAHTTAQGKLRVFSGYNTGGDGFNGFHCDLTKTGNM